MKGIGQAEYESSEAHAHGTSVQPRRSALDPELLEYVEYRGAYSRARVDQRNP